MWLPVEVYNYLWRNPAPSRFSDSQWRTQHTDIQGMSCTFGSGATIQSVDSGGMIAFDANVNQRSANTSPRNLAVQLCVQNSAVSASCQFVAPSPGPSINMRPSVQCPVPLRIPGYATADNASARQQQRAIRFRSQLRRNGAAVTNRYRQMPTRFKRYTYDIFLVLFSKIVFFFWGGGCERPPCVPAAARVQ